jgi:nicotinamide-nucleotide amidase
MGNGQANPDVAAVLAALVRARQTLAVAESLTGGLLSATIVNVPGASNAFRGGIVSYATDLKHILLGVPQAELAKRGPVDPWVAAAMAAGVATRCGADWGLSTTGVAGPDPQNGKPVGLVYLGLAGPNGVGKVVQLNLAGDRAAIRLAAVNEAIVLLADHLAG